MKILIVGESLRAAELVKCMPGENEIIVKDIINETSGFDIVFDLNTDEKNYFPTYSPSGSLIIASAVKRSLQEISKDLNNYRKIVGMCLLPTLINREVKELSFLQNDSEEDFKSFAKLMNWKYKKVKDSPGMVTPRTLAMIINEAAYTLQEGTAGREDIDKGMMLGTNYPMGPFTWCDAIGIQHIIHILESLYRQSQNERYKVCSLLVEKNQKKEKFYSLNPE